MNYGNSNCKEKVVGLFTNSNSLAFGYLKLIVSLATIIFYSVLILKYKTDMNYIIVLMFIIVMESLATTVFVTGYEGNKIIYLSWYNFTTYLVVSMKLAIGFIFVYFSKSMLVCPYVSLTFVDIVLLFSMRKTLMEHKKKAEVRFEFVNKLANHENIIRVMVPNVNIHGVIETENKGANKDSVHSIDNGTIATESLDVNKDMTLSTNIF